MIFNYDKELINKLPHSEHKACLKICARYPLYVLMDMSDESINHHITSSSISTIEQVRLIAVLTKLLSMNISSLSRPHKEFAITVSDNVVNRLNIDISEMNQFQAWYNRLHSAL